MEKILFPLKYMKQTQGVNGSFSHTNTLAIDYGNSGVAEKLYAPFTGIVRKTYGDLNFIWLESVEPVLYADGTIDYAVVITAHDEDISNLYVGKVIKQGEYYSDQGSAGYSTGVHTHIEVSKGKFTGSGWYKNSEGMWLMNNAYHPANTFFLTDDINIVNDGNYDWKKLLGNPVLKDESVDQLFVKVYNLNCRDNPDGNVLGYINEGYYNILEKKETNSYTWYKIDNNFWIAYNLSWVDLHEVTKKEEVPEIIIKPSESNVLFEYIVTKTDLYGIHLNEGEILKIEKSS